MQRDRLPYLLIPATAFLAILPLLIHGCSCGHDFDFHILSWMEAARQFTHGNLHPHWAYTPAYNAGEPRFVFYPPLSWIIGAILGIIFPWTWTPIVYTWLALTASGFALHSLAREFATPPAAVIAAVLYTVNPYMLFTAYERTAYAELLAAAFIPLLLRAILRDEVTIPRIAIPIALLWLTNAPAAVMSCYALALLTVVRIAARNRHSTASAAPPFASSAFKTALKTIAGTALGLGLAAFYIVPAAYERRYVQIAMAIIPTMRIQDNFLFHHTIDSDHDQVLYTASLIAILLLSLTVVALTVIRITKTSRSNATGTSSELSQQRLLYPLAAITIAIALLLTPLTAFVWNHAPELSFLQFPWRLLAILAAVLALAIARTLTPVNVKPAAMAAIAVGATAILVAAGYHSFRQTCDPADTVAARLALFHSAQGTDPTDEYTPITADNDHLAQGDPAYWLATGPSAGAPITQQPGPAPTHFTVNAAAKEDLVLNLRDYPAWRIALNSKPIATRIHRADGLVEVPIPAGPNTIDITYTHSADQIMGNILSLASLALLAVSVRASRRNKQA